MYLFTDLYFRDGFRTMDLHRQCDKKGSTLTIIYSKEGYIFGCYSPDDWQITGNKTNAHPETFVFTLSNPHSIPPTRYIYNPRATSPLSSSSPSSSVSHPSLYSHSHSRSHSSPSSPSPAPSLSRSLSPNSPLALFPPSPSPSSNNNFPMSPRRTAFVSHSPQNLFSPATPQNTVLSSSSMLAPCPTLISPNTNLFQTPSPLNNYSSPATPPRNNIRRKTQQWEDTIMSLSEQVLKFSGDVFYLSSLSDSNCDSSINFPINFVDTTGQGFKTFTGDKQFSTQEVVVFSVQ